MVWAGIAGVVLVLLVLLLLGLLVVGVGAVLTTSLLPVVSAVLGLLLMVSVMLL